MTRLRMAAYCRVSTQKQTQLDSLAHQRLFFASYARSNQLHLTHIYADAGISGRQMRNRTEFLHMLDDAQAGAFDVLCVKDISRFARNTGSTACRRCASSSNAAYSFDFCRKDRRAWGIRNLF